MLSLQGIDGFDRNNLKVVIDVTNFQKMSRLLNKFTKLILDQFLKNIFVIFYIKTKNLTTDIIAGKFAFLDLQVFITFIYREFHNLSTIIYVSLFNLSTFSEIFKSRLNKL